MSGHSTQIVYAGTYERDYPRNALVIAALRAAGYEVREIQRPVWERVSDKSGGFLRPAPLIRLALRLLWVYLSLLVRVARALPGADALVIGYIGQLDMLFLAPLAKLYRKPVVFNPLVTLTDTLVEDRELVSARSFAGRIVRLVDRVSLRLADVVLVDTAENGHYVQSQFGVPAERLQVVPVGADERYFQPSKENLTGQIAEHPGRGGRSARPESTGDFGTLQEAPSGTWPSPTEVSGTNTSTARDEAPIGRREGINPSPTSETRANLPVSQWDSPTSPASPTINVLFYGKMIPLHGVETVLRAAKLLEGDSRYQFTVIGQGQLSGLVDALASELELRNVEFIPWVAYERLAGMISTVDIVLGIFGDTAKAGRVVPNKVFQALACGATVVTRDSAAIRPVLKNGESARLVPPADPAALAEALRELADPAGRRRLGEQARQAFERTGSQAALAAALRPALDSVVKKPTAVIPNGSTRS